MDNWVNLQRRSEELLGRIAIGDSDALNQLWDQVRPFLLSRVSRVQNVGRILDGDILGFCYLVFHKALKSYKRSRGTHFLWYCQTILGWELWEAKRQWQGQRMAEVLWGDLAWNQSDHSIDLPFSPCVPPEDEVLPSVLIERLPLPYRQIARLLQQGYNNEEIKKMLGIGHKEFYAKKRQLRALLSSALEAAR